ncbi:hypothetical protein ACKWTF_012856 [Chironomus riparius]
MRKKNFYEKHENHFQAFPKKFFFGILIRSIMPLSHSNLQSRKSHSFCYDMESSYSIEAKKNHQSKYRKRKEVKVVSYARRNQQQQQVEDVFSIGSAQFYF